SSTTNNCFAIVALLKVTFIAASVTPHREVQFKCAALPNLALDGDAAPHLLHYVSRQIQAKADAGNIGVFQKFSISRGATHSFGVRSWTTTVKLVEQNRHVFRRYTAAVIRHVYRYLTILLDSRQNNGPTVWRVLDSIFDDVRQNPAKLF